MICTSLYSVTLRFSKSYIQICALYWDFKGRDIMSTSGNLKSGDFFFCANPLSSTLPPPNGPYQPTPSHKKWPTPPPPQKKTLTPTFPKNQPWPLPLHVGSVSTVYICNKFMQENAPRNHWMNLATSKFLYTIGKFGVTILADCGETSNVTFIR